MISFSDYIIEERPHTMRDHYIYLVFYRLPNSSRETLYVGIKYSTGELHKYFWAGLRWNPKTERHYLIKDNIWLDCLFTVGIGGLKTDFPKYKDEDIATIANDFGAKKNLYISSVSNKDPQSMSSSFLHGITEPGGNGRLHPLHPRILNKKAVNYNLEQKFLLKKRELKSKGKQFHFFAINEKEFPNYINAKGVPKTGGDYGYKVYVAGGITRFYAILRKVSQDKSMNLSKEMKSIVNKIGDKKEVKQFENDIDERVRHYSEQMYFAVRKFNENNKELYEKLPKSLKDEKDGGQMNAEKFVDMVLKTINSSPENKKTYIPYIEHRITEIMIKDFNINTQDLGKQHFLKARESGESFNRYNDVYLPQEFKIDGNPEYRKKLVNSLSDSEYKEFGEPTKQLYSPKEFEGFSLQEFLKLNKRSHSKIEALSLFSDADFKNRDLTSTTDALRKSGVNSSTKMLKLVSNTQKNLIDFYKTLDRKDIKPNAELQQKLENYFFEIDFPLLYNTTNQTSQRGRAARAEGGKSGGTKRFNNRFIVSTETLKNNKMRNRFLVKKDIFGGRENGEGVPGGTTLDYEYFYRMPRNQEDIINYVRPLIKFINDDGKLENYNTTSIGKNAKKIMRFSLKKDRGEDNIGGLYFEGLDEGTFKEFNINFIQNELPRNTKDSKKFSNQSVRKKQEKIYEKIGKGNSRKDFKVIGLLYGYVTPFTYWDFVTDVLGFKDVNRSISPNDFAKNYLRINQENSFEVGGSEFIVHKRNEEDYPNPFLKESVIEEGIKENMIAIGAALLISLGGNFSKVPEVRKMPEVKQTIIQQQKATQQVEQVSIKDLFSIDSKLFAKAIEIYKQEYKGPADEGMSDVFAFLKLYELFNNKNLSSEVFFDNNGKETKTSLSAVQDFFSKQKL